MNTKKSTFVLLVATAVLFGWSCKQTTGSSSKGKYEEANKSASETQEVEQHNDIAIDENFINDEVSGIIANADYEKYGLLKLYPSPDIANATFCLYESAFLQPYLSKDVSIRLVAQRGEIDRAWLVSYGTNGQMIDGYLVYTNGEKLEHIENHQVHAVLEENGLLTIHDNNTFFFDEMEIPVQISSGGLFDVFPEDGLTTLDYGDGWGAEGLYGKYPLGEAWTVIDLKEQKAEHVKTAWHYSDELNGATTMFDKKLGEYSNVGVKGHIPLKSVNFPTLDTLLLPNAGVEQLIKAAEKTMDYSSWYNGDAKPAISSLLSIKHNGSTYYLAVCSLDFSTDTYQNVQKFLVGVSGNTVYQLTSFCFYDEYDDTMYLFTANEELYLYAYSTSCGEGAGVDRHIYRLAAGKFIKEFQLDTFHD